MTVIDQPKITTRSRTRTSGRREPRPVETDQPVRPVTGVLDLAGTTAIIRGMDYLPSADDVHVPMPIVRSYGLRRGDVISGVAQPSDRRAAALIRVESVNGSAPELARKRPDFYALTPLYPQQRLLLETVPTNLTGRLIDLVMPIGKGQRALIVAPPRAGKTTVMTTIANAIARNHPECHIMVVLVDERPEEVTDMQRSMHGEVLSSTFDQSPSDHIALAELAIERAKRLVELGRDVVVLLDNITRLGRAYNNASRSSGRILTGGIDAAALTRRSASSAPPATSRTADHSPSSPPRWSRPVRPATASSSRSTRAPATPSSSSTGVPPTGACSRPSTCSNPVRAGKRHSSRRTSMPRMTRLRRVLHRDGLAERPGPADRSAQEDHLERGVPDAGHAHHIAVFARSSSTGFVPHLQQGAVREPFGLPAGRHPRGDPHPDHGVRVPPRRREVRALHPGVFATGGVQGPLLQGVNGVVAGRAGGEKARRDRCAGPARRGVPG